MSKLQVLAISIFIVLMVGSAGYMLARESHQQKSPSVLTPTTVFFSPTAQITSVEQVETTNWKTYSNAKEGFSIQYPSDISFSLDTNVTNGVLVSLIHPSGHQEYNGYRIYIASVPNTDNLSLSNPQQLFDKGFFTGKIGNASIDKTTLDGYEAFRANNCCTNLEYNYIAEAEIITIRNGKIYEIRGEPPQGNARNLGNKDKSNMFEKILSTFKFTTP